MRQRIIKPAFFTDALMGKIGTLTPPLLYMGLWLLADDQWVIPADTEAIHDTLFRRWERVTVVDVEQAM